VSVLWCLSRVSILGRPAGAGSYAIVPENPVRVSCTCAGATGELDASMTPDR
jgi:hypothetical protein